MKRSRAPRVAKRKDFHIGTRVLYRGEESEPPGTLLFFFHNGRKYESPDVWVLWDEPGENGDLVPGAGPEQYSLTELVHLDGSEMGEWVPFAVDRSHDESYNKLIYSISVGSLD